MDGKCRVQAPNWYNAESARRYSDFSSCERFPTYHFLFTKGKKRDEVGQNYYQLTPYAAHVPAVVASAYVNTTPNCAALTASRNIAPKTAIIWNQACSEANGGPYRDNDLADKLQPDTQPSLAGDLR